MSKATNMKHLEIDTLKCSKELQKAGATPELADAISSMQRKFIQEQNAIIDNEIATKNDLEKLKLELQSNIKSLVIKIGATIAAASGIIIASLGLLIQLK